MCLYFFFIIARLREQSSNKRWRYTERKLGEEHRCSGIFRGSTYQCCLV